MLTAHVNSVVGSNEYYQYSKLYIIITISSEKNFSRSINCFYHELHCKTRKPGNVSYRHGFQFGTGTERNVDFEEIQQDFDHTLVVTIGT